MRPAASGIAVSTFGSGIERLTAGSRNASTPSTSILRPAMMRASNSGKSWRCAMASARAAPRSSSRSRHARPVADCSTPRKSPLATVNSRDSMPVGRSSRYRYAWADCVDADLLAATNAIGGETTPAERRLELLQPAVLGPDPADGAGDRAHHHRLCLDDAVAELDAVQHRAVGDAGRCEQAIAAHHVFDLEFLARVLDAHLAGALTALIGVEHKAALHLAADAAQRRCRQHALGRAADAEVNVDAGLFRFGGVDDAGNVTVRDQADRRAGLADRRNQVGMARSIKHHRGNVLRFDPLGFRQIEDVLARWCIEI